ncbi:START-like domain protein [Sarocladium implicatum]|nr:START-like domain protein [Sarocladium implicatum]
MVEKFGHLVRLWGVDGSQLPPDTATPQEISPFLHSILLEAIPFLDDLPPHDSPGAKSRWKDKGTKTYPHATAPVSLFERTISVEELQDVASEYHVPHLTGGPSSIHQPETWTLRRSVHEDAAAAGTASWPEWVRCFKEEHAQSEKAFTPTVQRTAVKREWNCEGVELMLAGEKWGEWTLKTEESTHKMPPPLKPRTFPVVQATAEVIGKKDFLIVQIAEVEEQSAAAAKAGEGSGADAQRRQNGDVKGVYTSVERVREIRPGEIEWVMGTVSDAKGVLPAWVQRLATPSMIAKDVEMFLKWIAEERHKQGPEAFDLKPRKH